MHRTRHFSERFVMLWRKKNHYLIDNKALGLDDAALAWAAIEPIWMLPTGSDKAAERPREWASVTLGQLYIYAVTWVEREVLNGGFWQYFWNTPADLPTKALRGFERIRASEYADLLRQAIATFPGGVLPKTRRDRMRLLPEDPYGDVSEQQRDVLQRLEDLNERFYGVYGEGREFYNKLAGYIRAHPDEFCTAGPPAKESGK
ncbi:MAG: DUF4375 domain-containing protein [Planctomycetes bacterium]|nr:DUF4375 domain-containing protein [Planctomycetota bacterium]